MKYLPKGIYQTFGARSGQEGIHAVMQNVQPSDPASQRDSDVFQDMGSADNGAEALSELVRMASTLMVQEGLEAEQADFVGRERYERGERNGYRNGYLSGYKPGKLDTAEGRLSVALPQVRDAQQPFRSNLFDLLKGDSQMPADCRRATSKRPSPTRTACAFCLAAESARSPKRCGKNTKRSNNGT